MFFSTISSTIGRLSIETPQNCFGSQPDFSWKAFKTMEVDVSRLVVPCKWTARARNKHKLSLYGCLVFWSKIKQITWLFLSRGSGITESGHPMGMFLSKAAKMVTFVINLNRHFVFCLSCVQTSMISCFLTLFCIVVKSDLVQSSIDLSKSVYFHERRINDIHPFLYYLTQIPRQYWLLLHNQVFQRLDPLFQ